MRQATICACDNSKNNYVWGDVEIEMEIIIPFKLIEKDNCNSGGNNLVDDNATKYFVYTLRAANMLAAFKAYMKKNDLTYRNIVNYSKCIDDRISITISVENENQAKNIRQHFESLKE